MSKNINLFGIALAAIVVGVPSLAMAWGDCPSPYNTLDCSVNSANVCEYKSSPTNHIECNGSTGADTIYLVADAGSNLWAYGIIDEGEAGEEAFCCDATELGSTIYRAEFKTFAGDDVICMRDSDLTVNSVTICEDISEADNEAYPAAADIESGDGADYISTSPVGTHADDVDGGDDGGYILTWGGDDNIVGGDGVDYIYSGDHDDTVDGGDGNDYIYGNDHADILDGGNGDDVIYGGAGNDIINGDCLGCDTWFGNDSLYGDQGDDKIKGYYGADVIYGGSGDDNLCGDDDKDDIYGEDDDDCMCGGWDDVVGGNADGADDTMDGGTGSDDAYYWRTDEWDEYINATGYLDDDCGCACEP